MKKILLVTITTLLLQKGYSQDDPYAGTWKGTSICQQKNSPCHDEIAVYHISPTGKENEYKFIGNKMVNGKEEEMGIINYTFDAAAHTFTNKGSSAAVWKFTVNKTIMDGTLVNNGVLYRIIHLEKVKE